MSSHVPLGRTGPVALSASSANVKLNTVCQPPYNPAAMARKIFPDDANQLPRALSQLTPSGAGQSSAGSTVDDLPVNMQQVRRMWSPLKKQPLYAPVQDASSEKSLMNAPVGGISTPTIKAAKALLRPTGRLVRTTFFRSSKRLGRT